MSFPFERKPGDAVVRRPRQSELAPVKVEVEPRRVSIRGATSPMTLVYSFFALIALGAVLLTLPFSNEDRSFLSPIDALFTATSAATGTGLVLFPTDATFSLIGEIEIAVLIFVGGLGFMTGAAVLIFVIGQRVGLQGQLLLSAGLGESQLQFITRLAKRIILMAIIAQVVGAVLIFLRWYVFGPAWEGLGLADAIWQSIFTAISGFNNAGFDIIPDDLAGGASVIGFGDDVFTLAIIGVLLLLGSISYTSFSDALRTRGWRNMRLDSKLVLSGTALMLLLGFVSFLAIEWSNPGTAADASVQGKISRAAFHATNHGAGFSVVDYKQMENSDLVITEFLMFVGGASATTTSGIKVNTLMVLLFATWAVLRGRRNTHAFGRRITNLTVIRAFTVGITSVLGILLFVFLVVLVQPELDQRAIIFEVISAFATNGWSAGATSELNAAARVVITAAMFVGRFGPLTIALYMSEQAQPAAHRFPVEQPRIG